MPTIKENITANLAHHSLSISDVILDGMLVDADLDGDAEYTKAVGVDVAVVLINVILSILAMPDITEDGFSKKYDRGSVIKYVSSLCGRWGIDDPYAENPSNEVRNLSDIW